MQVASSRAIILSRESCGPYVVRKGGNSTGRRRRGRRKAGREGMPLGHIRERVASLRDELEIESRVGEGTSATTEVPLPGMS